MFKIEVDSMETQDRGYTTADGEKGTYKVQIVHLHLPGKKYPVEFPRRVPKSGELLKPGNYMPDISEMWINHGFGRLELTLAKVKPMTQGA